MPTAADPRLNGGVQLPISHSPLQRLSFNPQKPNLDPAAIAAANAAAIEAFLQLLDAQTGLDLLGLWHDYTAFSTMVSASLQQSWMNFQQFLNGLVQETDADIAAAIAYLNGIGEAANAAFLQIEDFLVTGNFADLTAAMQSFFQAIFGSATGFGLLGKIPAPAVVDVVQNLQPVSDFPDAASLSGSGSQWSWDGTVDHTGAAGSGSAKCVANGTLQELKGTPGAVQPGQVVTPVGYVAWSGLSAASGTHPIQLQLIPLSQSGTTLTAVTPVTIGQITSPGASSSTYPGAVLVNGIWWVELTGSYPVPSSGVAAAQLLPVVTAEATVGSVWFDDCEADVSGGFLADMQADTNNIIDSFAPGGTSGEFVTGVENLLALFGLSPTSIGSATDLTALWTAIVTDFINPLNAIELSAVNGLGAALSALLPQTTYQQLLDYVANGLGHSGTGHTLTQIETYLGIIPATNVTNVLGGADLGADVSSVHATVGTNTTSIASQQAWWNSLATDLWIYADLFHAYYPVGTPSDTATTTSGGRRTWYSAIADMKVLFAAIGSSPPVVAATDIGGAVNTAQSTATTAQSTATSASAAASTASTNASTAITNAATAQSTATTANTAAGTAQTTANTANTMFGLGQQAGTNLVLAPGFENAAAWTSASSGTSSTAQAHSGTNSWMLQGAGSGNITTLRLINNSAGPTTLKSRAGEVFQLQGFIYPKTGNTGGGTVKVQIVCTDSTGVNSPTTLVAATETVPATGSWSSLSGTATVPTGYDTVDPQLILLSVPTTDFVYVDDVLVRETTLVTSAQSTATAANANADSALSQLTSIPAQTVVPNLMAGASSVTFDHAGSGGSATSPSGSVSGQITATGTQTVGTSATIMIAAVTYSLVGSGSATGAAQVIVGTQQMQPQGVFQLSSVTEFIQFFTLWNPPVGSGQTVTANVYAGSGGIASVSFESASYIGATSVSALVTNSGTGTALSLSVSSAVDGTMAVAAFSAGDVITKANTSLSAFTKTSRGNTTVQVNSTQYGYQSLVLGDAAGGSGGVTFGATGADSSAGWVGAGLVLSATPTVGSGFRAYNSSTTIFGCSSGNNTFGTAIFPTTDTSTSDLSYSNPVLTISVAGWYAVKIQFLTGSYTSFLLGTLLYKNSALAQAGQRITPSAGAILSDSFLIYCNAGDTLQPGYYAGTAFGSTFTAESTGTQTYWEVALMNRSLL
jgi:hypothetical protein